MIAYNLGEGGGSEHERVAGRGVVQHELGLRQEREVELRWGLHEEMQEPAGLFPVLRLVARIQLLAERLERR